MFLLSALCLALVMVYSGSVISGIPISQDRRRYSAVGFFVLAALVCISLGGG